MTLLGALLLAACVTAGQSPPVIALIFDDMGYQPVRDRAALSLPGPVTFAILPFSPLAQELAVQARADGKGILLHLPMEARSRNHLLGPGALLRSMPRDEFSASVQRALREVPYLTGVNNHMGSALTGDLERMRWLMAELSAAGRLIYVDSRTTPDSMAGQAAAEAGVPYAARDVFLDNRREPTYIDAQFDALLAHAVTHGDAIGIAHPHAESQSVIRRRLTSLREATLVSLVELLQRRKCRGLAPPALPIAARVPHGE